MPRHEAPPTALVRRGRGGAPPPPPAQADRLHLAQPTVSQQIRTLEAAELGVQPFERDRRGAVLTPAGSALLGEARELLTRADRAAAIARATGTGQRGRLRMSSTRSPTRCRRDRLRLPGSLPGGGARAQPWHHDAPRRAAPRRRDRGRLRAAAARGPRLEELRLGREPMVCVLPRGHRLARRTMVRPRDLDGEPLVWWPEAHGPGAWREVRREVCGGAGRRGQRSRAPSPRRSGSSRRGRGRGDLVHHARAVAQPRIPGRGLPAVRATGAGLMASRSRGAGATTRRCRGDKAARVARAEVASREGALAAWTSPRARPRAAPGPSERRYKIAVSAVVFMDAPPGAGVRSPAGGRRVLGWPRCSRPCSSRSSAELEFARPICRIDLRPRQPPAPGDRSRWSAAVCVLAWSPRYRKRRRQVSAERHRRGGPTPLKYAPGAGGA